jgi:hypothetical protein
MQSSTALKAACLTAGLATAWAPPGASEAQAGTIQVNINFNASSSTHEGLQNVHLGLLLTDASYQILSIDELGSTFATSLEESDIAGYVAIGRTIPPSDATPRLWVSFGDPDVAGLASGVAFETVFASVLGSETETDVSNQLAANDGSFVHRLFDVPGMLQSINGESTLMAFTAGEYAGSMEVFITSTIVPLPAGVLMGGALLGCLAVGRRVMFRPDRRTSGDHA